MLHTLLPSPQSILGLSDIQEHYDVFILDIWGVIHDGITPYPFVKQAIDGLHRAGKTVRLLSNMPRRRETALEGLHQMGIHHLEKPQILTSGEAVLAQITNPQDKFFGSLKNPHAFYQVGRDRNADFSHGLPLRPQERMEDADFLLITLYLDAWEDPAPHLAELHQALELGLTAVCTNPDKIAMNGPHTRHCAGYFTEYYVQQGGQAVYYGKPHRAVYEHLFTTLAGEGFENPDRFLMVGDTPETDIRGAKEAGIDSALILSGILHQEMPEILEKDMASIAEICFHRAGTTPTWVLPLLKW